VCRRYGCIVNIEEVDVLDSTPVSEIPLSFLLCIRQVGRSTGLDIKVLNTATRGRIKSMRIRWQRKIALIFPGHLLDFITIN
jgi:hypothetical protein